VKQAYIKLAKVYHPDVNQNDNARENFDKITEAYTTLMDMTERYFYDQHGHRANFLKKKGSETIFDWTPKYGIYEESAEARKKEVEDWFEAQGHSTTQPKITLRQRLKNAFVELKFGMNYFNFPWNMDIFFLAVAGWAVFLYLFREAFVIVIQSVTWNPPKQGEIRDILWFTGLRSKNVSSQSSEASVSYHRFYHNPKPGRIPYIKSAQVVARGEENQESAIAQEKPKQVPVKISSNPTPASVSSSSKSKPTKVKSSSKEKYPSVKLSPKERNARRIERLTQWEEERHLKRMEEIQKMNRGLVSKTKSSPTEKVEKRKSRSKLQRKESITVE